MEILFYWNEWFFLLTKLIDFGVHLFIYIKKVTRKFKEIRNLKHMDAKRATGNMKNELREAIISTLNIWIEIFFRIFVVIPFCFELFLLFLFIIE